LPVPGAVLDAACGAGLYDGMLHQAGHNVLGIDQSGGMLSRAREHYPEMLFPKLRYEKMRLQEMDFHAAFEGIICMDAMEHISPEDWPGIMANFSRALKPGGALYVTVDAMEMQADEYRESYERARAMGLPVVYGEQVDELDDVYLEAMEHDWSKPWAGPGGRLDHSVYHYHPSMEQVRTWYAQAGFTIDEEAKGNEYLEGYMHVLARKKT